MSSLVGMMKEPCERFDIEILSLKGKADSCIVPVGEKWLFLFWIQALVVRIMIAVVAHNQHQIFQQYISKREMPVKLCPFVAVIMSDELAKDRGVFSKKDKVLESEIKSIFGSAEVVIAGKGRRKLELSKDLSMKKEFFFSK